ncbi:MAG: FAD-dependent oxidoreductase, partial [Chloroflexota bacterium]
MQKFEQQVRQFPIDVKEGQPVVAVSKKDDHFEVKSEGGDTYQGKTVIYAAGKRPRQLNVPGENEFRGKGVTYCAICDGPLFEGMDVAIVGGGNSALSATLDMVKIAKHVYLVAVSDLRADTVLVDAAKDAKNLTILTHHQVQEVHGDGMVSGVTIKSRKSDEVKRLDVGGVFVEIGLLPNSEPVRELVKLNELNEVVVNNAGETGVPGLFAAGDVTDVPEKQIVVAAGEGAKAALSAHKYLQRSGK